MPLELQEEAGVKAQHMWEKGGEGRGSGFDKTGKEIVFSTEVSASVLNFSLI